MSARVIRHVILRGRVQGVGFRVWVEHHALAHDLEGWVRNLRAGGVEAVFAGPAEAVSEMIETCRRGPPGARVETVDDREADAEALARVRPGERFSVLPTA